AQERISIDEHQRLVQGAEKLHQDELTRLQDEAIALRRQAFATGASAIGDLLGSLSQIVGQEGEKQLRLSKAFAIAQAVINTAQGVTKALATFAPPLSFIQAAAV